MAGLQLKSISQLEGIEISRHSTKISNDSQINNVWNNISSSPSQGFNPLSIANTLSVEVSDGNTSYRLRLSDILTPFLEACIWLKIHSTGFVTQEQLYDYVPWDLTKLKDTDKNTKAIHGGTLRITGTSNDSANSLAITGAVIVGSSSSRTAVEIQGNGSMIVDKSLQVRNVLSADSTSVKAINLSSNTLKVASFLTATDTTNHITQVANLCATSISSIDLSTKGQTLLATDTTTGNCTIAGKLTANNTGVLATSLSTGNLTAALSGTFTNIVAQGNASIDGTVCISGDLKVQNKLSTGIVGGTTNILCTTYLSSTNIRTDNMSVDTALSVQKYGDPANYSVTVKNNELRANKLSTSELSTVALSAGIDTAADPVYVNLKVLNNVPIEIQRLAAHNLSAGQDWFLKAPGDETTLKVAAISSTELTVQNTLRAGIDDGVNLYVNKKDTIKINSLSAHELTADGIAHLTAEAACWS